MLFPQPLHLVRTIDDPMTRAKTVVEEYCSGNRIVTVIGSRVAIADYDRQELTEIDRAAATYSVTPFAAIARANAFRDDHAPRAQASRSLKPSPLGVETTATGRRVDAYEVESEDGEVRTKARIGFDKQLLLSRAAVDVLTGAAYPNRRSVEHQLIAAAQGGSGDGRLPQATNAAADLVPFPSDQTFTYTTAGESLTVHTSLVRVLQDSPPPEVLTIPSGARLVESKIVMLPRLHDQLDGRAP